MFVFSTVCVEENTVLTEGRIILWAGGSLANDGSTVNSAWMKIHVRFLNSAWMKICVRILNSVVRKVLL